MEESNRNAQYWITFAISLALSTCSVSFAWTAPVLPKFHNNETNIHLTEEEISWFVSSMSPGMMAGCLAAQYPANKFGRRATVLASAFPFIIGTSFILTAAKAWMLSLGRFCWGFGCGMVHSVNMIYVVEIASKDIRGKLTAGNMFVFNLAGFLTIVLGSVTSYQTLSYALIVLPVCYFIACWIIPETPYFLLKQGKVDTAGRVLMKLNRYKDEKILEEKLEEMRSNVQHEMQRSGTLKELLTKKNYRRAIVISVGVTVTRLLNGSVPMKQYVGRILQETSFDISVSTGLIMFGAVRFISSMLASMLVDKVGRRPLLLYSYIGTALLFAILGGIFFMEEVMATTPAHFGYMNLTCNLLICIVSTLGFDTVGFIIPAELFPLNVKSLAMTYLNLIGYLINFISLRGYQILKDFSGLYGVFWYFGLASSIGAVFTYFVVPETKGKSLKEIQQELQGDLFNNSNGISIMDTKVAEVEEHKADMEDVEDEDDELKSLKD